MRTSVDITESNRCRSIHVYYSEPLWYMYPMWYNPPRVPNKDKNKEQEQGQEPGQEPVKVKIENHLSLARSKHESRRRRNRW